MVNDEFLGVRFQNKTGAFRSLELHRPHLQINNWWKQMKGYEGQYYRAFAKHFEILILG